MDMNKVFGISGEPIAARGTVLAVHSKPLDSFDDESKVATAYRVLVDENGEIVMYWYNGYKPIDGSSPEFMGTRVKLDGNRKATTADKFEAAAKAKGYTEVPEDQWPIQCLELGNEIEGETEETETETATA